MPIGGAGLREALPRLQAAFAARDRDPATLHIVPMGIQPDPAKLDHYAEIGVSEAVLRLPSEARDKVLPVLDGFTRYLSS
jgi:hypothetical protein